MAESTIVADPTERVSSGSWIRMSMFVAACATVAFMLYMVWMSELGEFAQGVVTLILGRFLGYIDGMYSFEFSTNRASARKDETIKDLAAKTGSSRPNQSTRSTDAKPPDPAAPLVLNKACPGCGTVNALDAAFCKNCGAKQ